MKTVTKIAGSIGLVMTGVLLQQASPWGRSSGDSPVYASSPGSGTLPSKVEPIGANIFVDLAKKAIPSVVNISTLTTVKTSFNQVSPEDLFRQFFGGGGMGPNTPFPPSGPRKMPKATALGTGFIVNSSGVILTNNHVVNGADEIKITFTENLDEKPVDATVLGRDPDLDVALIKVKTSKKLVALPLGDSEALEVGEYVMAVGNPYGNGHSVSHGIVSAKGRLAPGMPLASYIQIDAPINPGNSGGPLLNLRGEVVGINNAIDARAQGIGFAIPISYVKKILPQLEKSGSVQRGYIGAVVGQLTPELATKMGAPEDLMAPFITQVNPGSPAEKAGLTPYDVVKEVAGSPVRTPNEMVMAVTSVPVGTKVSVKILRNGKEKTLTIEPQARPGSPKLASRESDDSDKDNLGSSVGKAGMKIQSGKSGKGAVVVEVEPGGAADRAGIQPGDEIVEIDRKEIDSAKALSSIIRPNQSYLVRVKRQGSPGQTAMYSVVLLDLKEAKESEGG